MKKYCALLQLIAGMLAGVAIGQPSLPPLPSAPGLQPVAVAFGSAPVMIIGEAQVAAHLTNLALPADYVVRTAAGNVSGSTWNTTTGARLRAVPVQRGSGIIGPVGQTFESLGDPLSESLRSNCVATYFAAGGVEMFEVSLNDEIETAWIGQPQHQRYLALSKSRGANGWTNGDPDPWSIKYVNQRPWFALNQQRIGLLRIWAEQK